MYHNEKIRSYISDNDFAVRQESTLKMPPESKVPPERSDWERGLQREVMSLLTQKSSAIRDEIYDRVDEILLRTTLEKTAGNISQASSRLGISRPTLRNRLRQLKIETSTR